MKQGWLRLFLVASLVALPGIPDLTGQEITDEQPYQSPVIHFEPDGLGIVEAVRLTLQHSPNIKLQEADTYFQQGVAQTQTGAFDLAQSRMILTTAKDLGFPIKIHADEFDNLGGTSLAVELGAVSADHLVATSAEDIQALAGSDTVAVALPGTPFGLAEDEYTPAGKIIDAGGILALASDLNPGTSYCENMQMMIAIACRYMGLTPAQAIAAATINAAAAINREDKIGSLEEGKQADVLILDIPDYGHLGYRYGTNLVQTVIKKGTVYEVSNSK